MPEKNYTPRRRALCQRKRNSWAEGFSAKERTSDKIESFSAEEKALLSIFLVAISASPFFLFSQLQIRFGTISNISKTKRF